MRSCYKRVREREKKKLEKLERKQIFQKRWTLDSALKRLDIKISRAVFFSNLKLSHFVFTPKRGASWFASLVWNAWNSICTRDFSFLFFLLWAIFNYRTAAGPPKRGESVPSFKSDLIWFSFWKHFRRAGISKINAEKLTINITWWSCQLFS